MQNAVLTKKRKNIIKTTGTLWIKKILETYIKMGKVIKFGDIEIQKQKFYEHKEPISIKNIYINKIVVSNNIYFGKKVFKYVIRYKDSKLSDLYVYFFQK